MRLHWNQSDHKIEEEQKLWGKLRAGKREALNIIFEHYYSHLFNYSIRIVGDEELVKDALQELFIRLWERRESLGEADSLEAYLLSSVRRILLRNKESSQKKAEYSRAYISESLSVSFSMEEMMIQKEFRKEQKEHLYNAIQMLNDRQKEALFLRYYHGLTSNEIAIVMDVNPQSVRNHLARAIASLQSLLKVSHSISKRVL